MGTRSMISFEGEGGKGCNSSFFGAFDIDENGDECMDEYFHQPEYFKFDLHNKCLTELTTLKETAYISSVHEL